MAITATRNPKQVEDLRSAIERLDWAGFPQGEIAKRVHVTQQTVSYHLKKLAAEARERNIAAREERLAKRVAELQFVRQEAYDAWERSKQDRESTKQEQALSKIYDEVDGKRVPVGEELRLVKVIDSVEGRLPGCEYLQVMRQATMDIAKLQGLFDDVTVNNNNTQVNIGWDTLHARAVGGSSSGATLEIENSAQESTALSDSAEAPVETLAP